MYIVITGNNNITDAKLNTIPFARTIPKSGPTLNLIRVRAKNPSIVVNPLANIEENDFFIALAIASFISKPSSLKSANL